MDIEKLKNDFKIYVLDNNNHIMDNDLAIDYEINHNGIYIELIEIREGFCSGCDEFDFYIVDNDFYNNLTDYIIITPKERINLPVGNDSELEYFKFGVKIIQDEICYGINDSDEFMDFGNDYLLFSDNANLYDYLIDKMKGIMRPYE
ncbi:MAG: hypothetical protein IJH63_11365 [Methanobrevibacter sp.]|nr:hypothetical protein [Methanobrevibacter sp.]